jgi:hypothetical protein
MDDIFVNIDHNGELILDLPIQGLFSYWVEITRPYMGGAIGNAISRELTGQNNKWAEA